MLSFHRRGGTAGWGRPGARGAWLCWLLLAALAGLSGAPAARAQAISTVAGTGVQGFGGDGGPATSAQMNFAYGVAADGAGAIYIVDSANHRVRRVDAAGTIATVAGTGVAGYGGDGGPAVAAQLNEPRGIALDAAGNLYVADLNNHRIRRVDAGGTITTVAGTGAAGFSGDGGAATAAQLNSPFGVAADGAGRIYIADSANYRVRRVDAGGTIATIAGIGTPGYGGDNGPALAAQFQFIFGIFRDGTGNLFLADGNNHRIRRVDAGGTMTTVAGTGTSGFGGNGGSAVAAQLNFPAGVVVDGGGVLYIADAGNNRVRQVDTGGTITSVAGTGTSGYGGDGGPAMAAQLQFPFALALGTRGLLYVADTANFRTRLVTLPIPPGAPTGLGATASDGQARLAWTAPADAGSSPVSGYTATGTPVGGGAAVSCTATAPSTQCTAAGLGDGVVYRFTVRATSGAGDSPASDAVQVASAGAVPGMAGAAGTVVSGGGSGCALVPAATGFGAVPAGLPAGATVAAGAFRFRAEGCAGAALTVSVTYPEPLPAAARIYQYGPPVAGQAAAWSEPAGASLSVDRRTVTYGVSDDGAFDADTVAAGAIEGRLAPLVLAVASGIQPVPVAGGWGLGLMALLMAATGLAGLHRTRRRPA